MSDIMSKHAGVIAREIDCKIITIRDTSVFPLDSCTKSFYDQPPADISEQRKSGALAFLKASH